MKKLSGCIFIDQKYKLISLTLNMTFSEEKTTTKSAKNQEMRTIFIKGITAQKNYQLISVFLSVAG